MKTESILLIDISGSMYEAKIDLNTVVRELQKSEPLMMVMLFNHAVQTIEYAQFIELPLPLGGGSYLETALKRARDLGFEDIHVITDEAFLHFSVPGHYHYYLA